MPRSTRFEVILRKRPILRLKKKPRLRKLLPFLNRKCKLAYNRERDDKNKVYGLYTFRPHFLDIIAARCVNEVEEAKKRVVVTSDRKYKYFPSEEYIQLQANKLKEKWQQNSR